MSDKALAFFNSKYRPVVSYALLDGVHKSFVGTCDPQRCRYCGSDDSSATFKNVAHALPELIGNKWLIAHDECDNCNAVFAKQLDDQLAKYLGLWRTTSQISGKSGVPQTGRSADSHIKVSEQLEIVQRGDGVFAEIDLEKKEIRLKALRQPYVPVGVYKAFVKMAYAIMPDPLRQHYTHLPAWLLEPAHSIDGAGFKPLVVQHMFIPGPMPIPGVRAVLLVRKETVNDVPSCVFVVAFANHSFQLCLPSITTDTAIDRYEMHYFPANLGAAQVYGPPGYARRDFSCADLVREDEQNQVFGFEIATEITPQPGGGTC